MTGHLSRATRPVITLAAAIAIVGGVLAPATAASANHSTPAPNYDVAPATGGAGTYTEQQLATNGQGGFPNYRIPALTVTNSGDLLASYDGRPTGADSPGPNSILQRRSTDDGATWAPQEVVAAGKTTSPIEGYSDPSYLVDRETGTVFNFHVKSYDTGFGGSQPGVDPTARNVIQANVASSTDDGRTWSHRTITADITTDLGWRSRFAASGQGIQLAYGEHAGRLLQQYTIINGAGQFQAVSVYSDDHGATWQAGTPVGTGMDENKTVELSDGRIMLNSRDSARSGFRKVAYSTDGGVTYGPVTIDTELPDPTNNAAIVRAYPNAAQGSDAAKVLLFSNAASSSSRTNGVVRISYDDGDTWPKARVFQSAGMAYSTLATLPDGKVGLLYEPNGGSGGIRFAKFDLDWLLSAPTNDAGAIEVTGGTVTNPQTDGYAVGDVLNYTYRVANLSNAITTVSPTGNLERFDPAGGAPNCRYRDLPANGSYTCTSAQHTITQADLDAGFFTPVTRWTSTSGATVTTVEHSGQSVYFGAPGNIAVTGGAVADAQESYAVGDVLRFTYTVRNLSSAVTTVVPTGNLAGLDPAQGAPNCRFKNLAAEGSYTCTFAHHVVTQADLDAGSFTPTTTWTSTSDASVTVVEHAGETVEFADAPAPLEVTASGRCLAGKAYLAVRAENIGDESVDITLQTPFGERSFAAVAAGASAFHAFAARSTGFEAGAASAAVPDVDAVEAEYAALTCG